MSGRGTDGRQRLRLRCQVDGLRASAPQRATAGLHTLRASKPQALSLYLRTKSIGRTRTPGSRVPHYTCTRVTLYNRSAHVHR